MIVWLDIGGRPRRVELPATSSTAFVVDGEPIEADAAMLQNGVLSLVVEGRQYRCLLDGVRWW